jgi:hypothetical protein
MKALQGKDKQLENSHFLKNLNFYFLLVKILSHFTVQMFVLVPHVEMEIVAAFEAIVTDLADERLIVHVGLQMTLQIGLCWEATAADIAVERLEITVETFVEAQKASHLEVFRAFAAFVRPIS